METDIAAKQMFAALEEEWRSEAWSTFLPDGVYADRSLLNEFSDRRFDWFHYVQPSRYAEAHVKALKGVFPSTAQKWLTAQIRGQSGLTLVGPNGSGKTFAALAIARYASLHGILKNESTLWRPTCQLLECVDAHNLLDTWNKTQHAEHHLNVYKNTGLLILDDLGSVATSSQAAVANIVSIVNHRYNTQLPTVVTSNLGAEQLTEMYGSTMVRRIINDETIVAIT